ncbi:DUF4278 domain-containing protein [Palleronia pelagia]|uniref:DUF4278 domain-containing protein n=1 Tax=Palleronia pelagia TaxID=387096 RepID=A0A1H8AK39_9RHOB|nr:DUF4278 domain-containing protein [Palleronia pelagia]SEM70883.1 protein of unknown function [Palleronia pelagia]
MTTLIYRGIAHDGARTNSPRKPMNLIYRGVPHDGLSAATTSMRQTASVMCYRGVRYVLRVAGQITPLSEPREARTLGALAA